MISVEVDNQATEDLKKIAFGIGASAAKGVLEAASYIGGVIADVVVSDMDSGTGTFARSFLPATFLGYHGKDVRAGALSDLPYAEIQNDGGTIKPTSGKYLAVPLTSKARKMWPRDWPKDALQFIKSANGNALLAQMQKRKSKKKKTIATIGLLAVKKVTTTTIDKLVPQYVLKQSVVIKATHYLNTAERKSVKRVDEIMAKRFGKDIGRIVKRG